MDDDLNRIKYAGFWLRFLALSLDAVILWIPTSLYPRLIEAPPGYFDDVLSSIGFFLRNYTYQTTLWALYSSLMECSKYQGTLGKIIVGIKVTDTFCSRISFIRAIGRHFAKFLSALPLGLGFMIAGWTKNKQALHDMVAGCLVIKANKEYPVTLLEC